MPNIATDKELYEALFPNEPERPDVKGALKLAKAGASAEEIKEKMGCDLSLALMALSTVRPHALPELDQVPPRDDAAKAAPLTSAQEKMVKLSQEGLNQKEIAEKMGCAQSTVSAALKQYQEVQLAAKERDSACKALCYRTRMHIYLHDVEDWDKLRKVDFGHDGVQKEIVEAAMYESPELILMQYPYSEVQMDKLVMDIVLATDGACVVIADTYEATNTKNIHAVYFLRDCIHTVDFNGRDISNGADLVMKGRIQYAEEWFEHLGRRLSPNDAEKLGNISYWRF